MVLASVMIGACSAPTPEITLSSTETPSPPTPTETPAPPRVKQKHPTPVPVPTPESTETVDDVQARIVVNICNQYRPIVEMWYEDYPIDPNIILAVMAQESSCDPNSTDGMSIGLMQVTPKSWTLTEEWLWQPKWNIWQGMWMLWGNINHTTENPDKNMHRALAAYNCGWTSLNAEKCLYFGGPVYADRVLDFWLPYFEQGENPNR